MGAEESKEKGTVNEINGDNGAKAKNEDKGTDTVKSFTQEQVDAIKKAEQQAAKSDVYKKLGIEEGDEKAIAMFKAFIESQKTEEQKSNEEKAKYVADTAKAEQRARVAEVKAEALLLGANAEYIDDIVTLAMSKIAQNAGTDAKTAITEIKTKYAAFFKQEEKEDDGDSVGKRGTGSSIKNESGKGKKDSGSIKEGLGKRLATARIGSTNKSSFWS